MEYARLGSTDLRISRVGFGCAGIGGYDYGAVSDDESVASIRRALDLGVTFFDTADIYGLGHSEEILGRALGSRAKDVVVGTKVGVRWDGSGRTRRDLSPDWVRRAVDGSLKRLGIDCIPLYQIHWPDAQTPLEETMDALVQCVEAGKVRHLGCCNFSLAEVEKARSHYPLEAFQVGYNIADRTHERLMRETSERFRMAVLTYSSLAQGLFSGKPSAKDEFSATDVRRRSPYYDTQRLRAILTSLEALKAIGAVHEKTALQVAVRWALDAGPVTCAITGAKQAWQIEENMGALGWRLTDEELVVLKALSFPVAGGQAAC